MFLRRSSNATAKHRAHRSDDAQRKAQWLRLGATATAVAMTHGWE